MEDTSNIRLVLQKNVNKPRFQFSEFEGNDYKIAERPYISVQLPRDWYLFRPSREDIANFLGNVRANRIFRKRTLTEEDINAISELKPSPQSYIDYLRKCFRKLIYLGNSPEKILEAVVCHNSEGYLNFPFPNESVFEELVYEASLRSYSPNLKIAVIREDVYHDLSPFAIERIHNSSIGAYNKDLIKRATTTNLTQMSKELGISKTTIRKHLKALGDYKPKKERTKDAIKTWKKNNKCMKGRKGKLQEQCAESIGVSMRTVRSYWE